MLFVLKPFHVLTDEPTGTSHGTPYAYDTEVPFLLAGKGVKPGLYRQVGSTRPTSRPRWRR